MSTVESRRFALEDVSVSGAVFSRVWLLALAAYGVGDVVTTIALVWFSPLYVEANPVVGAAIAAFGGGGFLGLKLVVIYACVWISLRMGLLEDDPVMFYIPPVVLVVTGAATTGFNLALLL